MERVGERSRKASARPSSSSFFDRPESQYQCAFARSSSMTSRTMPPTQVSNISWSRTPCSSKNAVYGRTCVARPFDSSDLPPDVERTKESVSEYPGGVTRDGAFVDEIVNRSVTICENESADY